MALKKIEELLGSFLKLTPPDGALKEHIQTLLKEECGIESRREDISISNNTIYLSISSASKSEVFLKKEKLLTQIRSFSNKKIKDIK